MSRTAKPIETLLRLKQIKPDLEFEGQDAKVYQEFLDAQAEENLLATLRAQKEEKKTKKNSKKKTTKKVKQTIDVDTVETGEVVFNEAIDDLSKESV